MRSARLWPMALLTAATALTTSGAARAAGEIGLGAAYDPRVAVGNFRDFVPDIAFQGVQARWEYYPIDAIAIGFVVQYQFFQNDPYKTTICAYSTRAKEEPTVSTPVTWAEVQRCVREDDASVLRFTTDDVLRRVSRRGDLFADVATVVQSLPA